MCNNGIEYNSTKFIKCLKYLCDISYCLNTELNFQRLQLPLLVI